MGELVQSFLLRERLTDKLLAVKGAAHIVISCPAKMESKLRGMKNSNIKYWQQLLAPAKIVVEKNTDGDITVRAE